MNRGCPSGRAAGGRTRRGVVLGSAVIAGGMLAACGVGGQSSTAQPSARPVTVQFSTDHFGGARYETIKAAIEEYKRERPNVTIDLRNLDEGGGRTAHIAAGTIEDIVLWGGNFQEDVVRGTLLDITPYIKSLRLKFYDDWVAPEFMKEMLSYQGKIYGFPYQYVTYDWIYNKTWLRQASVKEPDEGWTFDTLADAAVKLTSRANDKWGAWPTIINPTQWVPIIRAYGGVLFTPDMRHTALGDAPALDAWEYLLSLLQPKSVVPTLNEQMDRKLKFVASNFAFDCTQNVTRDLDKQISGAFEWDVMPPPKHPKTGKRSLLANMQPHMITTSAQAHNVVEEAVLFGNFMAGEFVNGLVANYGGQAPFHKKVVDTDRYLPAEKRRWHNYGDQFRHSLSLNLGWSAWWSALQVPLKAGLNGEISARTMAQRLKDECNAAMDKAYADWDTVLKAKKQ